MKQSYRDTLKGDLDSVIFVYLEGSFELIFERMNSNEGHFMKADMLRSQFAVLEPPAISSPEAITVLISEAPEKIIEIILSE